MKKEDMNFGASPEIFARAKFLRENMTPSELKMWEYLSRNQLGVKFRRQHPLNKFIVDFYCHSLKLIIEIDGGLHEVEENKQYDLNRTLELEKFGLTIIRFTNQEVLNTPLVMIERIIKEIKSLLKK